MTTVANWIRVRLPQQSSTKESKPMDLNCPKCQSPNTQKNTSIVRSGTTHGSATTTSTSSGYVDGYRTSSTSTGTTRSTQQTALAASLIPARQYEGVWLLTIVGGILASLITCPIVSWLGNAILPDILSWLMTIVVPATFFATIYYAYMLAKDNSEKSKHYNKTVYAKLLHQYENGYYCHRCEHKFVP